MINTLILKIKRRENPIFASIYNIAKRVLRFSLPPIPIVHNIIYTLYKGTLFIFNRIWQIVWVGPLFKSQCVAYGKDIFFPSGLPQIEGNHLRIYVGNNVTLQKCMLHSGHINTSPILRIGNNTSIGRNVLISVAECVEIGDNTMIAHNSFIADNSGHPLNPERRLRHEAVTSEEVRPVRIGNNVWIGANCCIMQGSTIGDNSVITANSVVTGTVLPNKVMMGNPARAIKSIS